MRILITGASGQLGAYLLPRLRAAGHDLIAWSGTEPGARAGVPIVPIDLLRLLDHDAPCPALDQADPEIILHAAAVTSAEASRRDPARAFAVNAEVTARLAAWCDRHGRRLVYTSTDLVFDGSGSWYREDEEARPISTYGLSKLAGEGHARSVPGALVARLSLLYGPSRCGRPAYFDQAMAALRRGEPRAFFADEFRTPLPLATAAEALTRLIDLGTTGLVHVGGAERVSRYELMRRAATTLGLDPALVLANLRADVPFPEPRPADVSLDTTRLADLVPDLVRPSIEAACERGPGRCSS